MEIVNNGEVKIPFDNNENETDVISNNLIKIICFFPHNNSEFPLQAEKTITLKKLKKIITDTCKIDKNFKIFYLEKDLTGFSKIKIGDLFLIKGGNIGNNFQEDSETNSLSGTIGENLNNQNNPNSNTQVKISIIFTLNRTKTKKKSEKKLKYMLECYTHTNENAHFYCFKCSISFCTLCIESHNSHEYIDKYSYSKSSEEIVSSIMEDFSKTIKKMEEGNRGTIFSHIVNQVEKIDQVAKNPHKKTESNQSLFSISARGNLNLNSNSNTNVEKSISELASAYSELINNNHMLLKDKSLNKIEDFRTNLIKFKLICLNSLSYTQNKKITDIIVLEEDYFLEIHKTMKDLNKGKEALIKYMQNINKEFDDEKIFFDNFDMEIQGDIDKIIEKIRNKLKREDVANISKCDELVNEAQSIGLSGIICNSGKNFKNLNLQKNPSVSSMETMEILNNFDKKISSKNRGGGERIKNSQTTDDISTTPSEIFSTYIMKRRLGVEKKPADIIIYNTSLKKFETKKPDQNQILEDTQKNRKFFQFSVFLNIDNLLYISGGKKKNEKCVGDFFSYSPVTNELTRLPNMLKERCSHSMVHINNLPNCKNEIFVVGGYSNNSCERYSIAENFWEKLPDLNFKERQVPTLFVFNQKYLICAFGYINSNFDNEDYIESLDLSNLGQDCQNKINLNKIDQNKIYNQNISKWEMIKISNNLEKYSLKLFNVGILPVNSNQFLILGGEHYQGEETDKVYMLDMRYLTVGSFKNMKLPTKCSFIDKNFVRLNAVKFAQYEMKKNNLVFFNSEKCKFKIKSF